MILWTVAFLAALSGPFLPRGAEGRADGLAVERLRVEPRNPRVGDRVRLRATVHNRGREPILDVRFMLYVSERHLTIARHHPAEPLTLPPAGVLDFEAEFVPHQEGPVELAVVAMTWRPVEVQRVSDRVVVRVGPAPVWRRVLPWAMGGLAVAAAGAWSWWWWRRDPARARRLLASTWPGLAEGRHWIEAALVLMAIWTLTYFQRIVDEIRGAHPPTPGYVALGLVYFPAAILGPPLLLGGLGYRRGRPVAAGLVAGLALAPSLIRGWTTGDALATWPVTASLALLATSAIGGAVLRSTPRLGALLIAVATGLLVSEHGMVLLNYVSTVGRIFLGR